jgi:hypothetical protein
VAHPEIGRKKYLGLFSQPIAAHPHPQKPSAHAVADCRQPSVMPPYALHVLGCLGASRLAVSHAGLCPAQPPRCLPAGQLPCRPAPCLATSVPSLLMLPPVSASDLLCCGAGLPATSPPCPPGPLSSDGPASLLSSARRRLRPPSLPARRSGASLPPPPWLPAPCSTARLHPAPIAAYLHARLLGCSVLACYAGR